MSIRVLGEVYLNCEPKVVHQKNNILGIHLAHIISYISTFGVLL